MRVTTVKYLSDHRKYRYELVGEPKKQPNRSFIRKELATKVIIDRAVGNFFMVGEGRLSKIGGHLG